jgi:hypothetical protein
VCNHCSKRLSAEGFCEAVLLSHLREEQWKEIAVKQRRSEIYVLVRNLRSVAYCPIESIIDKEEVSNIEKNSLLLFRINYIPLESILSHPKSKPNIH